MTAIPDAARYVVPCGIVPEREHVVERTFLSSPWASGRSYLLSREAARAVSLAGERERVLRDLTDAAFDEHRMTLGAAMRNPRPHTIAVAEALAIARESAMRCMDQRPFDEQLFAAFVLLRAGLAEMATGEGKTLTAAVAGSVVASSGIPVHVISSNDYLVARDARAMEPLYDRMGLRVGQVSGDEGSHERRSAAYRCDVTYLTPRELAFDYLRDRGILGDAGPLGRRVARIGRRLESGLRQRGLHFAIVDEADDVLLDQARMPFVLSRTVDRSDARALAHAALTLARGCVENRDFVPSRPGTLPLLTEEGARRVWASAHQAGIWLRSNDCLASVKTALYALHDLKLDVDYVIREGALEIVNIPTGRRSPDQSFERGLHQLLEVKEALEVSARAEGAARIAGQALFRRYRTLCGMTGTATESRREFWSVYGLPVVRVPLRRPTRRVACALQCHLDDAGRDEALFSRVEETSSVGRPVLVGTGSVEESRRIADALTQRGVEVQLLNAAEDAEEASVIARAGEVGRVTVATNMAGRGTDIGLAPEVAQNGGLHIICARVGDSRRADRQLIGRCGRQGDPGSFEFILSLADPSFARELPGPILRWAREQAACTGKLNDRVARALLWRVQTAEEKRAEGARRALLVMQSSRDQLLAFAGRSE